MRPSEPIELIFVPDGKKMMGIEVRARVRARGRARARVRVRVRVRVRTWAP